MGDNTGHCAPITTRRRVNTSGHQGHAGTGGVGGGQGRHVREKPDCNGLYGK